MPDQIDPTSVPGFAVDMPAGDTEPPPAPFLGIPEQRLSEITDYCCRTLSNFRSQMGLDLFPVSGGGSFPVLSSIGAHGSWAWIRQCARMEFAGNFIGRRLLGGVFLENGPQGGWSLGIPKRFVNALASKAEDDLLGSDMFFAAMPENIANKQAAELSKQVETKVQKEIGESNLRACLAESIRVALTEGERPIKLTYRVDKTQFIGDAEVMVDPANPALPFKTPKGDYIYRKDDVIQIVVDVQGNFIRQFDGNPLALDQNQQPIEFVQNRLEKEPAVIMPPNAQFQLFQKIPMTIVHKDGLEADGLFCEDFIYDIFSPRLSECRLMAHSYDIPVKEIEQTYPEYLARKMTLSPTGPMARASLPILDAGEQLRVGIADDLINIHETYYRCRVNPEDPNDSWLFLIIDMTNRLPIYAEYLGNMKMKKPPFVILRGLRSEPGRAYGVGIYQDFRDSNLAIDVTFNRLMLKDSKEASVTFQNRAMIKELQEGHKLVLGGKEIYNISPNYPDEVGPKNPPVFRINLNEMSPEGWDIIDKLVSGGQLNFGVVSIGELEASDSGIGAGGTATATRNIERTGNVLQKSTQSMQAADIMAVLDLAVDAVLQNADPTEIMWVPGEQLLAELNREEIQNLPRDIRLTLTRSKGAEVLATSTQATQLVVQYYGFPPSMRKRVREFFLDQLRALEVQDADKVLEEPTDEQIQAEQDAIQNQPKESTTIALKDIGPLAPDERAQALKLLGIDASPPDQVAQAQQAEVASEMAKKTPPQLPPAANSPALKAA